MDRSEMGNPRLASVQVGDAAARYLCRIGTAHPNYGYCPASRRRCDGSDGVIRSRKPHRAHGSSGEGERLARLENPHAITVFIARKTCTETIYRVECARADMM